jgi:xanthine dehydrogenase small subunit
MPIGNARNQHIVTIEGINAAGLTPVQQCFTDEGATQCGFCTPGFIVSLTGYCLNEKQPRYEDAIDAVNGNICRCTGYKSIERALFNFNDYLQQQGSSISLQSAIDLQIVPAYFTDIEKRLIQLKETSSSLPRSASRIVGGGTDLYVQQHEAMVEADIHFIAAEKSNNSIRRQNNQCVIGAAATVADMAASPLLHTSFADLPHYIKLISSTQIRNMATLAGNFCNASPIGDLTIFFLALHAQLTLQNGGLERSVALQDFYKGYKIIDLAAEEWVQTISFELPGPGSVFNFEKVSKRTHLDIASVNTAFYANLHEDIILDAGLSAGGVGPVPLYLAESSGFLSGKKISVEVVDELIKIVQREVSPISDARGSADYKRLLLSQLIKAHFIKLFPSVKLESLITGLA